MPLASLALPPIRLGRNLGVAACSRQTITTKINRQSSQFRAKQIELTVPMYFTGWYNCLTICQTKHRIGDISWNCNASVHLLSREAQQQALQKLAQNRVLAGPLNLVGKSPNYRILHTMVRQTPSTKKFDLRAHLQAYMEGQLLRTFQVFKGTSINASAT